MKRDVNTWLEASEDLQTQTWSLKLELADWYQLGPLKFTREVVADLQYLREGRRLKKPKNSNTKPFFVRKLGQGGEGAEANRGTPATGRSTAETETSNFSNFKEALVCHRCQRKEHRAKERPSRDMATRRDGSRCRRCGGMGDWARACCSE